MVNVFIVHSGTDYDYVTKEVEPFLRGESIKEGSGISTENNANILTLRSGIPSHWKRDTLKQIKKAQIVIVVIGSDAKDPRKVATMGWEVRQALKLHKQLVILNRGDYDIPSYLIQPDRFSGVEQQVAKVQSLEKIKEHIDNYANGRYDIFSRHYDGLEADERDAYKGELLDQYKLFQKSSEDLVARRQTVNSFYITVNSAMVALMGIIMGVAEPQTKIYILFFMCLTGIILDFSWINILDAYGTLNGAKMKVIHLIEERLPVELYDAEWRVMSDKLNNKKYVSFTDSEKRIPKIFAVVYLTVMVFLIIHFIILHI